MLTRSIQWPDIRDNSWMSASFISKMAMRLAYVLVLF